MPLLAGVGVGLFGFARAQDSPVLITSSTAIAADNAAYEGALLVVQGCTVTIEGDHGFVGLTVVSNGLVEFAGTNLAVGALELSDTSRFTLAGGAVLEATNEVRLSDASTFVVLGKNTGAQVDGAWQGAGGQIRAASLMIAAGARLTADEQGYGAGAGPGAGLAVDSGAGHGGRGGERGAPGGGSYGSASEPADLGSGGVGSSMWGSWTSGGLGGGAIRVIVDGTLTLDGVISANGGDAILHAMQACCTWGSGGAGGSLLIQAGSLRGGGLLQANGGRAAQEGVSGAGGGGGRIAVYCGNADEVIGLGLASVQGGQGVGTAAQTGTVSFWDTRLGLGRYGLLLPGTRFDWPAGQTLRLESFRARQAAEITCGEDAQVRVAADCRLESGATILLGGGGVVSVGGTFTLSDTNSALIVGGRNTDAMVDGAWAGAGGLIEAGSLTVASGARISADGRGYAQGAGPGAGGDSGVGGGHGGMGGGANGSNGGATYGSAGEPAQPGSGGRGSSRWGTWAYGGNGGGVVRIKIADELVLDGVITADGATAVFVSAGDCCASGSGGAGGSVWIEAGVLRGSGSVHANGGQGVAGGADGGGGRLAIYYALDGGFTGVAACTALGGQGSSLPGQHGTVSFWNTALGPGRFGLFVPADRFDWPAGLTLELESLRVGAGANRPARFDLGAAGRIEAGSVLITAGADLVCGADAQVQLSGDATLLEGARLTLGGGGLLAVGGVLTLADSNCVVRVESKNNSARVNGLWAGQSGLIQAGHLTVAAGAEITASGQGYVAGAGPGGANDPGVGGGYGGLGGGSNGTNGGLAYGSAWDPSDLGSGGCGSHRWGTWATGGNGGGALRISVAGMLTLEGSITADGGNAVMVAAGDCCAPGSGGSGGSIWVDTETLLGSGSFRAEGGRGDAGGASGGGGRIAVRYRQAEGYTGFAQSTVLGAALAPTGQPGTLGFFDISGGAEMPRLIVPRERFTCAAGALLRLGGLTVGWPGASNAVFEMGEDVTFEAQDVTVQQGALLSVGGGSQFDLTGTLHVQDSNSLVLVQGRDAWGMISNNWVGVGSTFRASNIVVGAGATISADAQGYGYSWNAPAFGPGAPRHKAAGAGYGGATPDGGLAYGPDFAPTDLGSGGSGSDGWSNSTRGGAGGGAIHLIAVGSLTVDGEITANGEAAVNYPSQWGCCAAGGGGSGGSIFVEAFEMRGTGSLTANGGEGIFGSSGGAGGRIAVWTWGANSFPSQSLHAQAAPGTPTGENGTVRVPAQPIFTWNPEPNPYAHGGQTLSWAALGLDVTRVSAEVTAYRDGLAYTVAREQANCGRVLWNTTVVPDGRYEVKAVFRDPAKRVLGEIAASVFVNNAAIWHGGALVSDTTWSSDSVHLIESDLAVGSGVTLTIDPGTVVKVLPGRSITVASGGRLDAPATDLAPIFFTVLEDDTAGGDTNFDGNQSRPRPGEWPGLIVSGGTADLSPSVVIRYHWTTHSGALAGNETWLGSALHQVTGDLTVPADVTLTVQPGAIVKFGWKRRLSVDGRLEARGTVAQPITFTSERDDSVGGDTNGDGNATEPAGGDWGAIAIGGEADLTHTRVLYGGGTAGGGYEWGAGAFRTGAGAVLRVGESVISESAFEGIHAVQGGEITVSNTVIAFTDRAVNGDGAVARLLHCTLYKNRIGLWPHGGVIQARNCIISHSIETGVYGENDVQFCNVWSPTGDNGAFIPGAAGNVSVDPRFKNPDAGDFRLDYRSPCIDAADGTSAPAADTMDAPRYADPRTLVKTGTPTASGAYADLGAFEFVEEADSPVDLVVSSVQGPAEGTSGDQATVRWTIVNNGTDGTRGAWHDAISLVPSSPTGWDEPVAVAEVLSIATLGPGQSATFAASVRIPGGTEGPWRWRVRANARGEVFEGRHSDNNQTEGSAPMQLRVPELAVGAAMNDLFVGAGVPSWFKLEQPAG